MIAVDVLYVVDTLLGLSPFQRNQVEILFTREFPIDAIAICAEG